eukprot:scaffold2421_cov390-Prasinococcus_capsulatus_cf.AAC.9
MAMQGYKVAVLGAAGGIGQPLSLLMKLNPLVGALSLYDIAGTPGVAADISHINTPPLVGAGRVAWTSCCGILPPGRELRQSRKSFHLGCITPWLCCADEGVRR